MSRGQLALLKKIIGAGDATASLPIDHMRNSFETFVCRFPALADVRVEEVDAGGRRAQWVDARLDTHGEHLNTRFRGNGDRAILYLHGGGFVVGSPESHRQMAARLSRASGSRVLVLDYRRAPESPYPAALEDTVAAYYWLLRDRGAAAGLAVAGDSAGAGLSLLALTRLRDAGAEMPAAVVTFSPWVDYVGRGSSLDQHAHLDPVVQRAGLEKMAALYLGEADADSPTVSPLEADLNGLPPLLIQAGGAETLLDDSLRLAERARSAGVDVQLDVWPDMIHVWQLFAGRLEEGAEAIEKAGRFVLDHWQRTA